MRRAPCRDARVEKRKVRAKGRRRRAAEEKKTRRRAPPPLFFTFLSLVLPAPSSFPVFHQTLQGNHDADQQEAQGTPLKAHTYIRRAAARANGEATAAAAAKGGSDVSRRSTFVRSAAAPPPLVDGSPAGSSIAPAFRNLLWGVAKALFGCLRSKPEERDGRRWRKARGPQRWRPSSSAEAKAAAALGLLHLRSSSLSVLDAPPNLCAREAPSEISRSRCVFFRWEKGSSLASAPRMIRGPRAIFPSLTRFALKTTRKK